MTQFLVNYSRIKSPENFKVFKKNFGYNLCAINSPI